MGYLRSRHLVSSIKKKVLGLTVCSINSHAMVMSENSAIRELPRTPVPSDFGHVTHGFHELLVSPVSLPLKGIVMVIVMPEKPPGKLNLCGKEPADVRCLGHPGIRPSSCSCRRRDHLIDQVLGSTAAVVRGQETIAAHVVAGDPGGSPLKAQLSGETPVSETRTTCMDTVTDGPLEDSTVLPTNWAMNSRSPAVIEDRQVACLRHFYCRLQLQEARQGPQRDCTTDRAKSTACGAPHHCR